MHPSNRRRRRKNASAMRMVGALVALFRELAGLTQRELAQRAGLHEETIASIEQGRRALKPDLAEQLDAILGTRKVLETAVENLPEVDLIPAWAEQYLDLEREAMALSFYENQVLPGLLQTESYARSVFRSRVPAFSEEELNTQINTRLLRQKILHRKDPPTVSFVISQAVLMDRLGGDEVYVGAIQHLRRCADLPGIALQIMPIGRESHAALDGPFVLLETPEHQHLGYAETQRGSQIISDPDEVSILAQRYAMLRTQALNPEDSKGLLDRLLGEQ
ncbi:helix-turn-helix transcriptional regulator [Streptomyces sp. CBMA152]|uniref:helix-turn-helix domain-containing protein n=1 Tax=Streptomyces sp. CBMA152 TaxID=1896312 RepID=UPI00166078BC|nr:helix-turn-helix transcriptional regulator [Streptomyces sp. CBMA152]MBD0745768.1 transcriptional regulator [Streptomyces sp. CBMA152]